MPHILPSYTASRLHAGTDGYQDIHAPSRTCTFVIDLWKGHGSMEIGPKYREVEGAEMR